MAERFSPESPAGHEAQVAQVLAGWVDDVVLVHSGR